MTDLIKRYDALNACILREDNPPTEMQLSLRNVISALPAIDPTDRIEQTEAKLATCEKYRDAYAECDRIGAQAVRDLEAKLAKAVEARDGYLAERNKFQFYLQRTHADWELEVAAVDALNAKLTKAVDVIKCILASTYADDNVGYHVALYGAKALLAELEK